ncbi:MAG: flotillin [Rhodospirillales bacterium]|nr:flotillin [Rhodospirillales bacterium]
MSSFTGWVILALVVLAVLIVLWARFYRRATREVSLIKTGIGGRKVIMDGGCIVIPYFHEVSRVNMQTLKLHVERSGEAALITKDRLRVDVGIEFYVSVAPDKDGISRAAQTLGNRTFDAQKLGELIEGKLIDAARAVAARQTMDELHENRGVFVADVKDSLIETLSHNGLDLDSVSLTTLDQTPFKNLDENNAFNAVGMRKLAEVVAKSKKDRAEIDADADVSVRRAAMEVSKQKLSIDLEEQEAQIAQVQQIESLKAAQLAEVARRKADGEREAAQARITMEQSIRASDIDRERTIREAEINKDKGIREAEIAHELNVETANQDRQIALAAKSQETSRARTLADQVMAESVKASENISTVKRMAESERRKDIAVLSAQQDAEISSVRIRTAAKAERAAAEDKSAALLEMAKGQAAASNIRSEAKKTEMLAEADGQRALVDAENRISDRIVAMRIARNRLEALPKILAEMVKPAEKIESIKIHHVTGLGNLRSGSGSDAGAGDKPEKPIVNQAIDSILDMAIQLPAVKRIGEELGFSVAGGMAEAADGMLRATEIGHTGSGDNDKD